MRPLAAGVVLVTALLGSVPARARCVRECAGSLPCEVEVTDCLIAEGRAREAIAHLKPLLEQHPGVSAYAQLLARAYLAGGNSFWAERTLQQALTANPADCSTRAWLAWVHISTGELDLARRALKNVYCPHTLADRSRWQLLAAFMAHEEGNHAGARAALEKLLHADELYPEDSQLFASLRRSEAIAEVVPLQLRIDVGGGYTSRAMAGSPTDPGTPGSASGLGRLDLFGRFQSPTARGLRPGVEAGVKGHGLTDSAASDLSYLELTARPSVTLAGKPSLLLGYRADLLLLNQDTAANRRFYEGHRAELELELAETALFAGAGRRIFRQHGRSRWEVDGGLGRTFAPHPQVRLLVAASLRYHQAVGPPYDQVGATTLAVARLRRCCSAAYARLGLVLGLDYYHHSGGERGLLAYGTRDRRTDLMGKLSVAVFSAPVAGGARFGLSYELTQRESTASDLADYDYLEHRLLVRTQWSFDLNPWAPGVVRDSRRVPLAYGSSAADQAGDLGEERIQDLLRQDEASRRGSSCID